MERASRSDLIETISNQKDKLERYETKLRDIVQAYRGLLKEKEALEATVSILDSNATEDDGKSKVTDTSDAGNETVTSESEGGAASETTGVLSERVKVLTSSVATLSQEKSRLESMFIADKKSLKQQNEDLQSSLEHEREARNKEITELTGQVQEMKNKVRCQQLEREKEQTDHVLMLRELQKLLAEERSMREKLEFECDEMRVSLRDRDDELTAVREGRQKAGKLAKDFELLKQELRAQQEKSSQPPPIVRQLENQIADLKERHNQELQRERERADAMEDRARLLDTQDKVRVSSLETSMSELSSAVGDYERVRCRDQESIKHLRETISQLNMENTALTQAMASQNRTSFDGDFTVKELCDKIMILVDTLKSKNDSAEYPVDIRGLLYGDQMDGDSNRYREELEKLREEYECYKLRAQSVLKNKNTKDGSALKEIESMKDQLLELKEKLRMAYGARSEMEEQLRRQADESRESLLSVHESHKREIAQLTARNRQQLADVEMELRKQRARTVTLLAEKDHELDRMRRLTAVPQHYDTEAWLERNAGASEEVLQSGLPRTHDDPSIGNLVGNPGLLPNQHETMLYVHFTEEQARKDVEIGSIRKQKRQLEIALRELEGTSRMKEEHFGEKIGSLEEEVRKQQRDKSRESANLEYLKNVTFRFLTSGDVDAKERMLNAISTILQFSPEEKKRVQLHRSTWW